MNMVTALLQSIVNGVLMGGAYALIAVGTTIIFAVMKMINFTTGAFLMLGMYSVWLGVQWFPNMGIYGNILFAIVLVAIIGYICFRTALLPIMQKHPDSALIVGMGLAYMLQNAVILVFGALPLSIDSAIKFKAISLGPIVFSVPRVIAFGGCVLLSIGVSLLLQKTLFGRAMRATAENTEVSEMLGINYKFIYGGAWTLGVALMAFAGVLLAPTYVIQNGVAVVFRNTAFVAVLLGGLGNIKGAFISGIMLGVIEAVASVFVSLDFGPAAMFILFLIVVRVKPLGLFGKGVRVG